MLNRSNNFLKFGHELAAIIVLTWVLVEQIESQSAHVPDFNQLEQNSKWST